MERSKRIVRTSVVGIAVNLILVLCKAAVGVLTNSIAVMLDAVNNLSDALSSAITIVGTRLAGKRPDRKHPYGHGRIEYLTAVLIAAIILLAGVLSFKESFEKILAPQTAHYSVVSLVVLAFAVAAKLAVGLHFRRVGREVNSDALRASGSDAFFDAVLCFATLVAGVVCLLWDVRLEGYLGVLISVAIFKAGIDILRDSLSSIIGIRADPKLTKQIKARIRAFPEVRGAYDLTLHNYGPTQLIGSVHIEVADDMTAKELHRLTRRIAAAIYLEFGITLTVGIYASNDSSPLFTEIRSQVERLVSEQPEIRQMHGFYCDEAQSFVMFDLIVSYEADGAAVRTTLLHALEQQYPQMRFDIVLDSDISD